MVAAEMEQQGKKWGLLYEAFMKHFQQSIHF